MPRLQRLVSDFTLTGGFAPGWYRSGLQPSDVKSEASLQVVTTGFQPWNKDRPVMVSGTSDLLDSCFRLSDRTFRWQVGTVHGAFRVDHLCGTFRGLDGRL